MKKISIFSLLILITWVTTGCGDSKKNTATQGTVQHNTKAVSISGLNSLDKKANIDAITTNSGAKVSMTSIDESNIEVDDMGSICTTGNMEFSNSQSENKMTFNAEQCFDGISTIDGEASLKTEGNEENPSKVTATVTRNISLNDNTQNSFSLEKGAILDIKFSQSGTKHFIDIETAFKSIINGVFINVSGFNANVEEDDMDDFEDDGKVTIKSGEFNIGEYYFKIDESKNNVIDDDTIAVHMTDGAGHKVLLADEDVGLVLKVDENADGIFNENEIMILAKYESHQVHNGICPAIYEPVCASNISIVSCPDNNPRCKLRTFGNSCELNNFKDEYALLYEGECKK